MASGSGVLTFGEFELDPARRELRHDGRRVELQRTPLQLLLYLAEHRDRTVPSRELLEELWPDSTVTDGSLSNAVHQVRRAMGDDGVAQRVIQSLRGQGYRFVADAALAAAPPIRAIAVLPLENLSGDPGQEHVADGMTDALISELAKIGSLRVISRTSVERYKSGRNPAPQIASELGVEGLVEGSVILEGGRIRINLQLVDARSDTHLWAHSYERDLGSVLALQGEVARAVASAIRVALTTDERSRLTSSRTVKPQAYDAYMRAMQLVGATDVTGIQVWGPAAIEHVEVAVELDPGFAEAWVLLGRLHLNLSLRDFSARCAETRAREAAQKAVSLDAGLGGTHVLLGGILRFYDWDFAAAGRAYERAVELGPNDPIALNFRAVYLSEVEGRTREALALGARAALLDPFSPMFRVWYGNVFIQARQWVCALEQFERAREVAPGFTSEYELYCTVQLGRIDAAYRSWMAGPLGLLEQEARARAWSNGGWRGALRAWIDAAAQRQDVNPAIIARTCAWVGEKEEAFSWLERAYRVRDPVLTGLKSPLFDSLHSDPRYDEFLRRVGFPEGQA